jgi:hypothetical protein
VRDVALVPQRDVLEPGLQVPAQHPRQPAELLRLDRVALVRHRARALLLALAEGLLGLAHLGALQVPDLERERLDRAPTDAHAYSTRRGDRAREHLRRGTGRARAFADVLLDERIDVGERADRARQLADRDHFARPQEPFAIAPHLQRPERELHAERRRLGVDAVRAPDHRRVAEFARRARDRRSSVRAALDDRSRARVICSASAVSTTSLDVRP